MGSKLLHSCFAQRCHAGVLEMVKERSGDREWPARNAIKKGWWAAAM